MKRKTMVVRVGFTYDMLDEADISLDETFPEGGLVNEPVSDAVWSQDPCSLLITREENATEILLSISLTF